MATWRCPYCGTPQAETGRCWVCHRSTTSCGACRHFRRSVVAQLGYCGKDRLRSPLSGDEIRACWERGADRHPASSEERPLGDESAPPAAPQDVPFGWGLWAGGDATRPAERPR